MGYYIDLATISIERYKSILKTTDLLPSWRILGIDIDKNMNIIKLQQIDHLEALFNAIKNNSKIQDFSEQSGLPVQYLTVLRRVVNGYLPKPNKFKDFPNVDQEISDKLVSFGIKNTFHIYARIITPELRSGLSRQTGISLQQINVLARLADLSRVKWVNHTFAYVLFEAGYQSAKEVAEADPLEMYERIKILNTERKFYKGNIGARDIKRCVDAAQWLDFEIV